MDLVGGREREPIGVDELVVGLKCGGSDGLSGITANPVIGRVSDRVAAEGGTSVLCEVPEMFGAEDFLLGRCDSRETFDEALAAAKPGWVDFDAVLACASGRRTSAERRGAAEVAIWKDGVTL